MNRNTEICWIIESVVPPQPSSLPCVLYTKDLKWVSWVWAKWAKNKWQKFRPKLFWSILRSIQRYPKDPTVLHFCPECSKKLDGWSVRRPERWHWKPWNPALRFWVSLFCLVKGLKNSYGKLCSILCKSEADRFVLSLKLFGNSLHVRCLQKRCKIWC